jgi:hypothetical protein
LRAIALLVLALGACHPPPPDTPVASYLAFLSAVRQGDAVGAFDGLSTPTREKLEARAKVLSEASGGAIQNSAPALVFSAVQPTAVPTDVREVKVQGEAAELEVVEDGGAEPVRMVHEHSGWKVDLSAALK